MGEAPRPTPADEDMEMGAGDVGDVPVGGCEPGGAPGRRVCAGALERNGAES